MWSCPYCGHNGGVKFKDENLKGMLCALPDCGRFDEMTDVRFESLLRSERYDQSLV